MPFTRELLAMYIYHHVKDGLTQFVSKRDLMKLATSF